ncbi:unnamed protein product, partial [Ranitomeya imitator]
MDDPGCCIKDGLERGKRGEVESCERPREVVSDKSCDADVEVGLLMGMLKSPRIRVGSSEDMKCGSQAEKWSRKWMIKDTQPGKIYFHTFHQIRSTLIKVMDMQHSDITAPQISVILYSGDITAPQISVILYSGDITAPQISVILYSSDITAPQISVILYSSDITAPQIYQLYYTAVTSPLPRYQLYYTALRRVFISDDDGSCDGEVQWWRMW